MYKQNTMKKILIAVIGSLLMVNAMAQIKIDRTKQPKPGLRQKFLSLILQFIK
jgi:hypothetical protein